MPPDNAVYGRGWSVDEEDRTVYRKILAAHLAAAEHPRLGVDDFLWPLLSPQERQSEAYLTYDYLQGRTDAFREFLLRELGYASPQDAWKDLEGLYGDAIRARAERYERTGR
jgi:hypothetical protein